MTETIEWTNDHVLVSTLKPHKRNPRRISKDRYSKLLKSIENNGFYNPIIVDHDSTILAGHQRLQALKELGHKTVDIRRPRQPLPKETAARILASDNLSMGEFDLDILSADFEIKDLVDWGFDETILKDLAVIDVDTTEITETKEDKKHTCPECGCDVACKKD